MVSVVVAEKPAVARDIAHALGISLKKKGYFEGKSYLITWAVGHLLQLKEPHEMHPEWKKWDLNLLPMIPAKWELKTKSQTQEQYATIKKLFSLPHVKEIICATDAGREGELIFRYIFEQVGIQKPVKRLWISSLTLPAIKKGFESLRNSEEFDALAASAKGRSQADWLVGMNLSRAYSLSCQDIITIGRVQTPTLSMLATREKEIQNFQPEKYKEIKVLFSTRKTTALKIGIFSPSNDRERQKACEEYEAWYVRSSYFLRQQKKPAPSNKNSRHKKSNWMEFRRLPVDGKLAEKIVAQMQHGSFFIRDIKDRENSLPPPQFYDLTELQRHANRVYGFSSAKTLEIAQSLYEQKKCISYPRTDCRYISDHEAKNLPELVKAIIKPYQLIASENAGKTPLSKRFCDSSKITDHHAIIPTTISPRNLQADQSKIYDLVCRRFLSAWSEEHLTAHTQIITEQSQDEETSENLLFLTNGTRVLKRGWKVWEEDLSTRKLTANTEYSLPQNLKKGQKVFPLNAHIRDGITKAPAPMSEAKLLTGMETAGRTLEDKELSEIMQGSGLGTPATRAAIIENLQRRGYIYRQGKALRASDKGMHIIQQVAEEIKSPKMTGEWEAQLEKIKKGQLTLNEFIKAIEKHVEKIVKNIKNHGISPARAMPLPELEKSSLRSSTNLPKTPGTDPLPLKNTLTELLTTRFHLQSFRGKQKQVCNAIVKGIDSLLVMPTGAGKSLCYQLPGIARGGTTIIVSPLIALMEDQVSKLCSLKFAAERIHSGRERVESQEVCRKYLQGMLDFLFIAPERLGLRGFIELLARKKPTLIAIDEAHCISQWGHDFRSDYRKLGERLTHFENVPKIAMTATATLEVQDDIIRQLNLGSCKKFIAGFRRKNLEIEVIPVPKPKRIHALKSFLKNKKYLPAIIYALSRKDTEEIAKQLKKTIAAKPYHAGLGKDVRQQVQEEFMKGSIDAVVATVAFGMGIDKENIRSVIHMGLPSSIAGYYQEIGRGGRDQKKSKVVLMYSYLDQKTHLFLHEKNYPDPSVLKKALKSIPSTGIPKTDLYNNTLDSEEEALLEKLWVHGAVSLDPVKGFIPRKAPWLKSYERQKSHKLNELKHMWDFAENSTLCRMLQLVNYFGDKSDQDQTCGLCDVCKPQSIQFKSFRVPSLKEQKLMENIWKASLEKLSWSKSSLYRHLSKNIFIEEDIYRALLDSLINSGILKSELTSFTKKGREINYYQVSAGYLAKPTSSISWKDVKITEPNFH